LFLALFLIEVEVFANNLHFLLLFLVNVYEITFALTSECFGPAIPDVFFLHSSCVVLDVFDSAQAWDFFSDKELLLFRESFIELLFVS